MTTMRAVRIPVGGGGYAEYVVVHEREAIGAPDGLSWEEAAAVPEVFVTAHDALVTRGRLAMGPNPDRAAELGLDVPIDAGGVDFADGVLGPSWTRPSRWKGPPTPIAGWRQTRTSGRAF